jgi:hypothetical protein
MTKDAIDRKRTHRRLWLALAIVVALLVVLIVPPMVSVSRYKKRITQLMSASLGRPVRLSSVEVRLLPRPGFVLSDLTVDEDPAYGAEPVLHANTVQASVRLLSLWRGRLVIDRVSVDEASLNLVRTPAGRWNLDPFLRTAAQSGSNQRQTARLPYLVATNSRINIKNGAEKLPFSLMNSKLSFGETSPGEWRVQLRGEPVRTDVSLEQSDTGEVKIEATLHRAAQMRQVPVHLDMEWTDAQFGQLSRLILGSDSGWRGNLTGEMHLDGTAEAINGSSRLRASNVHRAEFAPASPLDFDAKCSFVYHFTLRSMENLACDSPLGDGHILLAANLPGDTGTKSVSVELDKIPATAALDVLRTVRSGFAPGFEADGSISGKILYKKETAPAESAEKSKTAAKASSQGRAAGTSNTSVENPLSGSLVVDGLQLRGEALSAPIRIPKLVLEPVSSPPPSRSRSSSPSASALSNPEIPPALAATVAIPAGGATPLAVSMQLALSGYHMTLRGPVSIVRAKEAAHMVSARNAAFLDDLGGEPLNVDLVAAGPWIPAERMTFSAPSPAPAPAASPSGGARPGVTSAAAETPMFPDDDQLTGTVNLRNSSWKADYLANQVQIAQATLHLDGHESRWDPVVFTYGPVKGTATLTVPGNCEASQACRPTFGLQFGTLDLKTLQAALLGAREPGTLLSTLLSRLRPASLHSWPQMDGAVKAESLIVGPVTMHSALAAVRLSDDGAEITGFDAAFLGGHIAGVGNFHAAANTQSVPSYSFSGRFEQLSPQAVGQLVGERWSGGAFAAEGKIELSGYTARDLAASAKGSMHFEWKRGAISSANGPLPASLKRFDRWSADANISDGSVTLKQNQIQSGSRSSSVGVTATLDASPKVSFVAPNPEPAKK